ncbi:MAG: glycerol-3-phosphate acyltransferase [bacterium]|nr:glycerol-3-phosphate acyltransferase [bacterium]
MSIIIGYIIGSILFAIPISKLVKGINIMEVGTKNPGAANVLREVGKPYGVLVWLLDTAKGAIAMLISAKMLTGRWIIISRGEVTSPLHSFFVGLTGIAAFCGHCWPLFNKFKGGRGVSTSGGVFFYLIPKILPIAVAAYFFVQRKPRDPKVIITTFAVVFSLIVWIYWAQRIWLTPFIIVFLIVAIIANIPTIKEMQEKRKLKPNSL